MDYLPQQWRYRILLVASSVVALWTSFFLFPPEVSVSIVRYGGYWIMALTFGLFVVAGFQFIRSALNRSSKHHIDWVRWAMVGAISVFLQIHEPHGFKVVMDELVLAATSMSMHLDREVFCPLQINNFDGADLVSSGIIDKRPYFFAFFLSLAHDLTGYRPENAFFLNAILTAVMLGLVGQLGAILSNRCGGRLAVLLMAGLPLLAINATGGGFEILNMCMILITMLAGISYLNRHDSISLNLLVLSGILLAQTRYESVVFIIPTGLLVLVVWWRTRSIQLTFPLLLAPLLLVPYPLLNSIFRAYRNFWQLPEDLDSPFSLSFFPDNLSHAVSYLFDFSPLQSNSVLLSTFGVIAIVFMAIFFFRKGFSFEPLSASQTTLLAFGSVIIANFALLMCYHWGKLDQFVVSRLGFPLMLLMGLAVPFVLNEFKLPSKVWNGFLGVALAFFLFWTVPTSARAFPSKRYLSYQETAWFYDFVRDHRDEGAYFVIPSALPAVILRQSSCSNSDFANRAVEIDYHLRRGTYTKVYVLQRFMEDLGTGELTPTENSVIGDEFLLEIQSERKFGVYYRSRISVISAVNPIPRSDEMDNEFRQIRRDISVQGLDNSDQGKLLREYIDMLP